MITLAGVQALTSSIRSKSHPMPTMMMMEQAPVIKDWRRLAPAQILAGIIPVAARITTKIIMYANWWMLAPKIVGRITLENRRPTA